MRGLIYNLETGEIRVQINCPANAVALQYDADTEGFISHDETLATETHVIDGVAVYVPAVVVPPTLEELKASTLAYLATARYAEEIGGLNLEGFVVKTDRESQAQLNNALTSLKNGFITYTDWKGANSWAQVTLEQIEPIARAVSMFVASLFAKEKALAQQVEAATTAEEVAAIIW